MTQPFKYLVPLLLLIAACQGGADTTPPTLTSSAPSNGASAIVPTAKLALVFSEAINPGSLQVKATPNITLGAAVWNDPRTAVFTPAGGWQPNTSYSLSVEGQDLAGNALTGNKTIAFQTAALPDITAPQNPSNLQATAGDGSITLAWTAGLEPDLAGYTVFWGTSAAALDNASFVEKSIQTYTIPSLENNTLYYFALEAQDTNGNRSPKSTPGSARPKDQSAPSLVSSEPSNSTANLSLVPNLRLSFSEPIDRSSLRFELCFRDEPPATADCPTNLALLIPTFGPAAWSEGDRVVQLDSNNQFSAGRTTVLYIFASDTAGNPLASPTKLVFSLASQPDTTAPRISGWAISVNSSTNTGSIVISFSEPMNQQSVQSAFLSQPALGCSWTWSANSATCQITSGLVQQTTYTLTVGTGARDTAGNALLAAAQNNFTTPNFAPRVIAFRPSSRVGSAINVSITAPIVLTFSEAMNTAATQAAFSVEVVGSGVKTGTITWNASNTEMTFTPSSSYGYGKTVRWTLRNTARDSVGTLLAAEVASSFNTELQLGF